MVLPQVGRSRPVTIGTGAIQGRVDAPYRFKAIMDVVLRRAVVRWDAARLGIWIWYNQYKSCGMGGKHMDPGKLEVDVLNDD